MDSAIARIQVLLGIEATRVGSGSPPASRTGHRGEISRSMGLSSAETPGHRDGLGESSRAGGQGQRDGISLSERSGFC